MNISRVLQNAKLAATELNNLTSAQRQRALVRLGQLIQKNEKLWLDANKKDQKIFGPQLSSSLFQRLILDNKKIHGLALGTQQVAKLPELLGKVTWQRSLAKGVRLKRITVPIGVIAIIFESRPDVLPQILSLCLKTANAVLLKGGRETTHSNRAFMKIVSQLRKELPYLPKHWAQLIESRADVHKLLKHDEAIDLIIPRGSKALVRNVMTSTNIPVLGHADGICHIYVHRDATLSRALPVTENAKLQHPSACNALETLLVHKSLAKKLIPAVAALVQAAGGEIFGCPKTLKILRALKLKSRPVKKWNFEHGNNNLSIGVVNGVKEAIAHIQKYGSKHTDAILSNDRHATNLFQRQVDSAGVYVNASTRFADGFRYGFGAEVGVSTAKTHARGPVGLEGLITYKYFINSKKCVGIDVLD